MKLQVPFIQLPIQFDAARLTGEMRALDDAAWRPHPQKYPGNLALPLISARGDPDSDATSGPMQPTPYLDRCPYLVQLLARLGAVWGRTRLMKLDAGAEVTPHADIHYYWRDRVRVHVPILTHQEVRFICGEAEVNMRAGECWIFDTWRPHRVINATRQERVHLVADTVGSETFWNLAAHGRPFGHGGPTDWRPERFEGGSFSKSSKDLILESINVPEVMTPWEVREHIQFILSHAEPHPQLAIVQQEAGRFIASWRALWAHYGESPEGWPTYRKALDAFIGRVEPCATPLRLTNGMGFMSTLRSMVLGVALADRTPRPLHDRLREGAATDPGRVQ